MQQQLMAAIKGTQSASTSSQISQWQGSSQNGDVARNYQTQTRTRLSAIIAKGGAYASWVSECLQLKAFKLPEGEAQ